MAGRKPLKVATSQLIKLEMTIQVLCPNPKCRHHKAAFDHVVPSRVTKKVHASIAKKGGQARWSSMSPAQRKEHVERMVKARRTSK